MAVWEDKWAGFNGTLEVEPMKKKFPCLGKAKRYQKETEMSSLFLRWVLSKGTCLNHFSF